MSCCTIACTQNIFYKYLGCDIAYRDENILKKITKFTQVLGKINKTLEELKNEIQKYNCNWLNHVSEMENTRIPKPNQEGIDEF